MLAYLHLHVAAGNEPGVAHMFRRIEVRFKRVSSRSLRTDSALILVSHIRSSLAVFLSSSYILSAPDSLLTFGRYSSSLMLKYLERASLSAPLARSLRSGLVK